MSESILKVNNISSLEGNGVGIEDGNVLNPALNFSNDPDTGLYRIGDDRIAFSSNGVKVGEIGTHYGAFKGGVVQCVINRYDMMTSVNTGTTNDGIEIIPLRISITPKFVNSMIICMFQVFGEGASTHNYIMRVFKNGNTAIGDYAGFNKESGNVAWSGIAMSLPYEGDYSSTPHQAVFYYHDFPNTVNTVTYGPGVKETGNTNYTYFINRSVSSPGVNVETGVSFSIAWEIAQ